MSMRIAVNHTTDYELDHASSFIIQQVRLTPRSCSVQDVTAWNVTLEGGSIEAVFADQHGNETMLFSLAGAGTHIRLRCEGVVETIERAGVFGPHRGFAPIWLYQRSTALTKQGERVLNLVAGLKDEVNDLDRLHVLNEAVAEAIRYEVGRTDVGTSAEEALKTGCGVCQDHAHAFVACARNMGFPARYVSGYLALDNGEQHEASHAWAEAHVEALGWVGFDPANRQCPDERYIRLAVGLDYAEAAPMRGLVIGGGASAPIVTVQIQQ